MHNKNLLDTNSLAEEYSDISPVIKKTLSSVREDLQNDPYILEALRVLPVGGYRSAIGSFWNAVINDLRNKVLFRSIHLFNKALSLSRKIETYEDLQEYVNDDQLIEGAYAIGIIDWEASKVLKHAKETRHIFSGHPKSSDPSVIKVLTVMEDCIKYVLNKDFPVQIIDVGEYVAALSEDTFDRNIISVETALTDLPYIYKTELANRLFTSYIDPQATSTLRSNIEFVAPILWQNLNKQTVSQVIRRVDQEIMRGNSEITLTAFKFVELVKGQKNLSMTARRYKITPLIDALTQAEDDYPEENKAVKALSPYASIIPENLMAKYTKLLTRVYVGRMGSSPRWTRTNFYADGAALYIPDMFKTFDDNATSHFIEELKKDSLLKNRLSHSVKLQRLRNLGAILMERVSDDFQDREFLEILCDEDREEEFYNIIRI